MKETMNQFVGTWELVAFEEEQPDGQLAYPYGNDARGLLMYDASGRMAVQIMRRERQPFTSEDWQEVSGVEIKSAVSGFTAFWGRFTVDEASRTVIHQVEGHVLPNSVGKALPRSYEFSGNRLILKPAPNRRVIWQRVA